MKELIVLFSLTHDWSLLPRDRSALTRDDLFSLPQVLDSYSEAALEYAFRLRDEAADLGETLCIRAVSLCGSLPDPLVKNLFASGVRDIYTISANENIAFTPCAAAADVASFLKECSWDMILTGWQDSTVCDGGMGVYLARMLGVPYLAPLSDLTLTPEGLRLYRALPEGSQELTITAPAVCAVGNAVHPYLRMATLREKLAIMGRVPQSLTMSRSPCCDPTLSSISTRTVNRTVTWLDGEVGEQAAALLQALSGKKEGNAQ